LFFSAFDGKQGVCTTASKIINFEALFTKFFYLKRILPQNERKVNPCFLISIHNIGGKRLTLTNRIAAPL
jgi:hypothetical protein